jgi:catechol 2,3-dioxygenase-like lactoylglutathione lyase family enzyme
MIDHSGFAVSDFARSKQFYQEALSPLGIELLMDVTAQQTSGVAHAGFGSGGRPFFWIGDGGKVAGSVHIAFTAISRAQVDAFHKATLRAGGRDNGAPGLRLHYHPDYYGAFILDPGGYNIEAVCHNPE